MKQTLQDQLEALNNKYSTYYKANRKHLAYGNVKATIQIMREQIARLEDLIKQGEQCQTNK